MGRRRLAGRSPRAPRAAPPVRGGRGAPAGGAIEATARDLASATYVVGRRGGTTSTPWTAPRDVHAGAFSGQRAAPKGGPDATAGRYARAGGSSETSASSESDGTRWTRRPQGDVHPNGRVPVLFRHGRTSGVHLTSRRVTRTNSQHQVPRRVIGVDVQPSTHSTRGGQTTSHWRLCE
jgi:hypothetical protein